MPAASSPDRSAAPSSHPSPRRRGEATAERILDAAEALFAAKGYAATSLRDVADVVGLRIPSLYNHIESKEALYEAVLARVIGPVLSALAEPLEAADSRARVVALALDILAKHPNLPRLVQHEILAGGERLSPLLSEWLRPVLARAEESIEATGAAKHWDAEQIPLLALALFHVVIGYFGTAPVYRELTGVDLLDEDALSRHTRFFQELVSRLLPEDTHS